MYVHTRMHTGAACTGIEVEIYISIGNLESKPQQYMLVLDKELETTKRSTECQ